MNNIKPIDKKIFHSILGALNSVKSVDENYIYDVYASAIDGIAELQKNNVIGEIGGINHFEVIQYCLGEYLYSIQNRTQENIDEFVKSQSIFDSMVSVVADKYLSLSKFTFNERTLTHKYLPPVSSLYVYLNFISNILNGYQKKDPKITLVTDLLIKAVSIARCCLDLLIDGFETVAFSSWRTLHESECVLIALLKNGKPAFDTYLKHMRYGLAYRDTMDDKDKQTEIFMEMKEEMREKGLKSKDIKKYIEYGWLYACEDFKEEDGYKLNFRDGLEKIAGLTEYASRYEMSSEIIHSTPLLIYSSKEFFYFTTLLSLYESFFRIEKVFNELYIKNVSEEIMKKYENMRSIYFLQLINIHHRESTRFVRWKKLNKNPQ